MQQTVAYIAVQQFFDKKRSIASGIIMTGVAVGMFAWPPFMELLFRVYGFQGGMLIQAGIQFNCCICGILLRPLKTGKLSNGTKKKSQTIVSKQNESLHANNIVQKRQKWQLCNLHVLSYGLFLIGMLLQVSGHSTVVSYTPLRAYTLGYSPQQGALLVSAMAISSACLRAPSGWLGTRQILTARRPYLHGTAVMLAGVLSAVSVVFNTYNQLLCFGVIFGAVTGG